MTRVRQQPYLHGGRFSCITLRIVDSPDSPGNDWSCVSLFFVMNFPISLMVSWSWDHNRLMVTPSSWWAAVNSRISEKPHLMSSHKSSVMIWMLLTADL